MSSSWPSGVRSCSPVSNGDRSNYSSGGKKTPKLREHDLLTLVSGLKFGVSSGTSPRPPRTASPYSASSSPLPFPSSPAESKRAATPVLEFSQPTSMITVEPHSMASPASLQYNKSELQDLWGEDSWRIESIDKFRKELEMLDSAYRNAPPSSQNNPRFQAHQRRQRGRLFARLKALEDTKFTESKKEPVVDPLPLEEERRLFCFVYGRIGPNPKWRKILNSESTIWWQYIKPL